MNREIKFRAWNEKHKEMVYWDGFFEIDDDYCCAGDHPIYNLSEVPVMQYTGLKDKNGKEIYEGDIILVPDEWTEPILDDGSGPREPCNHLAPVIFRDGSYGVDIKNRADIYKKGFVSFEYMDREIGDVASDMKVIGNIYENPLEA